MVGLSNAQKVWGYIYHFDTIHERERWTPYEGIAHAMQRRAAKCFKEQLLVTDTYSTGSITPD